MKRPGQQHRSRRRWLPSVLCTVLAGCAATSGVTLGPLVIHNEEGVGTERSEALESYYQTVFARMRDALRGGTSDSLAELRYLVQLHKREGMVAFAWEQMERFELLADGLEFELDLPRFCTLVLKTAHPNAHGKLFYELRVAGYEDQRVLEIGGAGPDTAAFQVLVQLRDFDSSGQFVRSAENLSLRVDRPHRLVGGQVLTIPFEIPGAGAHIAIRELSIQVELLPGVVKIDGRRLPVSQFTQARRSRPTVEQLPAREKLTRGPAGHARCCETRALVYPEGYEAVQKEPLQTLLTATGRGGSKWFRHVFVATHFMPDGDREKAMARLIQWVRNGTGPQRLVAMGCLRILSREDLSLTARDAWLRWWQSRETLPK